MKLDNETYQFYLLVNNMDEIDRRVEIVKETMPQITDIRLHRITQYRLTVSRGEDTMVLYYDLGNTPYTGSADGLFVDKELWKTAMYVFDADAYEVRMDITRKIMEEEK